MSSVPAIILVLLAAALLAADYVWLHGTLAVQAARALDATIERVSIWR